jgi:hypothetical protein
MSSQVVVGPRLDNNLRLGQIPLFANLILFHFLFIGLHLPLIGKQRLIHTNRSRLLTIKALFISRSLQINILWHGSCAHPSLTQHILIIEPVLLI